LLKFTKIIDVSPTVTQVTVKWQIITSGAARNFEWGRNAEGNEVDVGRGVIPRDWDLGRAAPRKFL